MKIKICGLRRPENIMAVAALQPDLMGFIFYPKSSRYVKPEAIAHVLPLLDERITKVGVFVNAPTEEILITAALLGLDALQLHGSESPEQCRALRSAGYEVIKALPVRDALPAAEIARYDGAVDALLFDTYTSAHGGSGRRFDAALLADAGLSVPYYIAGGMDAAAARDILTTPPAGLLGLDFNSRLELMPGLKSIPAVREVMRVVRPATVNAPLLMRA